MVLMEDYYIRNGDGCIIFLGDDGREHILLPGAPPEVGSKLVVHPSTGDILTHGHEVIKVGDTVIVVPLDDGDQAALKPAISQETNCKPIIKWAHDTSYKFSDPTILYPSGENIAGKYRYRSYDIHLSEPFYREDHDMNLNLYCMAYDNEHTYSITENRWPWGAVTVGYGYSEDNVNLGGGYYGPSPDVTWYWHLGRSPYDTVTGGPTFELHQNQDNEDGVQYQNGEHFCIMDALNTNTCNDKFQNATTTPPEIPIEYIHVQVRSLGTMYGVGMFTKSFLQALDVCREVPSDCEIRCYGGRNVYPPIPPHDLMEHPEDWEEAIEEWP